MTMFSCFATLIRGKNKQKVTELPSKTGQFNIETKSELSSKLVESNGFGSACISSGASSNQNFMSKAKVMNHESPVREEEAEAAYEGEDEHEENLIKRSAPELDLLVQQTNEDETEINLTNKMDSLFSFDTQAQDHNEQKAEEAEQKEFEIIPSGHVSDPGIGKTRTWDLPKLKRSCSNLENSNVLRKIADELPPSKSQSFEELQKLAEKMRRDITPSSPLSVITNCSADRVMLKKHSSSQILPSRSKRLWWKLYLWSHRNLHKSWTIKRTQPHTSVTSKQQGGYCSDTLEPNRATELNNIGSPGSFTGDSTTANFAKTHDNRNWNGFQNGISGFWPQHQWVAFPGGTSSYSRVDEWVKDLETLPPFPAPFSDDGSNDEMPDIAPYKDKGKSPEESSANMNRQPEITLSEEVLHANYAIQSLNSSSTVAHISGIGLKVIPPMARFASLRSVNLSNNFIVHITPGSLPKGLHTLNLSRNKITTIEGLRELTRLRVLDLSYNRIARIGQGLSNCTLIKELYLAGNKISDVEGLHRLLKLTVLDLSFNKITTKKALGQLVANYSSLLALNLLGNPIQSNISDDQLRKAVCGLLPKLIYLNKQPTKPQRAREVLMDSVAKAALGDSKSSHRKAVKRINQGSSSYPSSTHRSSRSVKHKDKHRSRSHARRQSPLQTT